MKGSPTERIWSAGIAEAETTTDSYILSIIWTATITEMRKRFPESSRAWATLSQAKRIQTMRGKKYSFENFALAVSGQGSMTNQNEISLH